MADKTGIEWTDATWNPVRGCTKVSSGCDNCYAERDDNRWNGRGSFDTVRLQEHLLDKPLSWKRPRRIFVNSMSDLFHDDVPDDYIVQIFARMWWAPQHTYQILTKRHGRMRSLLPRIEEPLRRMETDLALVDAPTPLTWPLPNVWLGVSVETQNWADIRIPALLDTPAAVRWISAEPLLGPIDLFGPLVPPGHRPRLTYWLDGRPGWGPEETTARGLITQPITVGPRLDWVVAGGESGPGARPAHPHWFRQLRDQCVRAQVPFLFKQRGEYTWEAGSGWREPDLYVNNVTGEALPEEKVPDTGSWQGVWRVGKKRAGRDLDRREWNEYPTAGVR